MDRALLEAVCAGNRSLASLGLVDLTWGNVSGRHPETGLMAIKPSGVEYGQLTPDSMVVLNPDGSVAHGKLRPSSDSATHLELYRAFPRMLSIVHTHSRAATALCQMGQELPALGTTHADHFDGTVPLVRALDSAEVDSDYELNTARAIISHLTAHRIDPIRIPAVLQHLHGPFSWGESVQAAIDNAVALEACASMALSALAAGSALKPIPQHILGKHQSRKHGPDATYGQIAIKTPRT